MTILVHLIIFAASIAIIWFFAGVLIDAVTRISRQYCKSGFLTAFFLLGTLTSISELSVAANSLIGGVPSVSAGNLIGASFVILLLVIPLLVVAGKGVRLNGAVTKGSLAVILGAILLPALLVIDGSSTWTEGILLLLAYGTVVFALYRRRVSIQACDPEEDSRVERIRATFSDIARIVIGGIVIFTAAHFLVEQATFFATALSVPDSLIGLLMLSLGTNVPEIVIALRSIFQGRSDIALGDYLGSAVMNTFIFGVLAVLSGSFAMEASEFIMTAAIFVPGVIALYMFAISRFTISRNEGIVLLLFYVVFFALQVWNVVRFAAS